MTRTIFVSSTFVDLQTHRKSVWDLLEKFDVTVRGMEQFGARPETPLQTCLVEVDQSDIYVGIIGFRLGSLEPTSGKSYTQLEYERAIEFSKETFLYLIDEENARVAVKFIDRGEEREKLEAFKRVLRERHTVDTFKDEADLAAKIERDLARLLAPQRQIDNSSEELHTSKAQLRTFMLLPKAAAGTEIRLRVRATAKPYPASQAVCQAFNFEFGATIGVPIEVIQPEGIEASDFPDLYLAARHALDLLPITKGDVLDGYMKLHFAAREIESVRARFKPHTEYRDTLSDRSTALSSILGEPIHHKADSRLALELSRTVQFSRAASAA
jgi:Domain of unknown function (DUF4062)